MNIIQTGIEGLVIIEPTVFEDSRGYFYESYQKKIFLEHNIQSEFIQDNQSLSHTGVLRGLHFQNPPFAQAKLVRVISGSVLDIAVDIRKDSKTYGHVFSIEINDRNRIMLHIPVGFAHGFQTLEDNTIFFYKCSNVYHKDSEDCILWNDPTLNVPWKNIPPILSGKDKLGKLFTDFNSLF
jgi:dTDP-4-dehydrorhamnose 3,5-epimerase